MEQKMGVENGGAYNLSSGGGGNKLSALDPGSFNLPSVLGGGNGSQTVQKRKVGRPITSPKTMNRSFPAVDEIRLKLEAGECYVRPRASSSSSDVWALFQEVAYKDTHFFTGIVQCKSCKFFTRYHGQITGTSHMRRHHCFSLLFPNSVPATRKAKNAAAAAASSNGGSPGNSSSTTGLDADSTTPRMMAKKMKKEAALASSPMRSSSSASSNNLKPTEPMDFSSFTQLAMSAMNGPAAVLTAAAAAAAHNHANSNGGSGMSIHSTNLPKKRLKNGNNHHYLGQERSLINGSGASNGGSSSATLLSSMAQSIANANNGNSNSVVNSIVNSLANTSQHHHHQNHHQQQQSMLRPMTNHNNNGSSTSPGSSPNHNHHHGNHHSSQHQQMLNQLNNGNNLNVPSTVTNNLRIQNAKQDLRERLVAFCAQELVPLATVNSEAFRAVLQSHLRLCTTQLQQQLTAQQQQQSNQQSFPQLVSLTSMVTSFMNHLSHQMPDGEQLAAHLKTLHGQCRERIRADLARALETNVGGALVCDSEGPDSAACIFSAYYIDDSWRLVEAVLGASSAVTDINAFISGTLTSYAMQDAKKLAKFTFVSHGGIFDGTVALSLSSMAHTVDKVVEEALITADFLFAEKLQGKKGPKRLRMPQFQLLGDLLNSAAELAVKCNLPVQSSSEIQWIKKLEAAREVLAHRKLFEVETSGQLNFDLLGELLKLLEPFATASVELRQCFKHPTLSHVLLYYYKLKKVLASGSSYSALMRLQTEPTNLSTKRGANSLKNATSAKSSTPASAKVNGVSSSVSPTSTVCPVPPKKAKRARSFETSAPVNTTTTSDQNSTASAEEDNSDEEKDDVVKPKAKTSDDSAAVAINGNGKRVMSNGGEASSDEACDDSEEAATVKEEDADDDDDSAEEVEADEVEAEDEKEAEEDEEQEESSAIDLLDPTMQTMWILDQLKRTLLEKLTLHYEVQTLHRIATFLWPNFRFLKMLTGGEQKEVHEEVRKMMQLREVVGGGSSGAMANGHGASLFASSAISGGGSSSSASSDNGLNGSGGKVNGSGRPSKTSTDFDEWEVLSDHDQDEVDKYLSVQLTSCSEDNVLQWWREHSVEFPKLAQLAKWVLAIPASVTTRERFRIGASSTPPSVDDMMLFLHCNMQNSKFDLNALRKTQAKSKVKHNHSKNNPVPSAASLIAQPN